MNIFDIQQELYLLTSSIIEAGGEATEEQVKNLTILESELESKLIAYSRVIDQLNGEIDTIGQEVERLNASIKYRENTIDRLKAIMNDTINRFGEESKTGGHKLKYLLRSFWTVKSRPVIIEDEDIFIKDHPDYVRVNFVKLLEGEEETLLRKHLTVTDKEFTRTIKKDKLKEDLKNKIVIEGASLDEVTTYPRFTPVKKDKQTKE